MTYLQFTWWKQSDVQSLLLQLRSLWLKKLFCFLLFYSLITPYIYIICSVHTHSSNLSYALLSLHIPPKTFLPLSHNCILMYSCFVFAFVFWPFGFNQSHSCEPGHGSSPLQHKWFNIGCSSEDNDFSYLSICLLPVSMLGRIRTHSLIPAWYWQFIGSAHLKTTIAIENAWGLSPWHALNTALHDPFQHYWDLRLLLLSAAFIDNSGALE